MDVPQPSGEATERAGRISHGTGQLHSGSVAMMPYQAYQLYQAERTKTAAEIRRADDQLGEFSRALSSAWHQATRPKAVLRALQGAVAGSRLAWVAGEQGPVGRPRRARPVAPRRVDYLTLYRPCFPSGPCGQPGKGSE